MDLNDKASPSAVAHLTARSQRKVLQDASPDRFQEYMEQKEKQKEEQERRQSQIDMAWYFGFFLFFPALYVICMVLAAIWLCLMALWQACKSAWKAAKKVWHAIFKAKHPGDNPGGNNHAACQVVVELPAANINPEPKNPPVVEALNAVD